MRITGSKKGKDKASSSSPPASKRQKKGTQITESETVQVPEPKWTRRNWLCDLKGVCRKDLYYKKLKEKVSNLDNLLVVEKAIKVEDFRSLKVEEVKKVMVMRLIGRRDNTKRRLRCW
ncbi:hypothetical protein HanHA300_Chr13g0490421 [Helianthus annuus]|nr:hypothetical protein HanHA300_Chr13g0490421 [Helianthus annuus]KAJ0498433.1 hypothetical protein HanHA89_Chr13g0522551 [Helianthus annuus]